MRQIYQILKRWSIQVAISGGQPSGNLWRKIVVKIKFEIAIKSLTEAQREINVLLLSLIGFLAKFKVYIFD